MATYTNKLNLKLPDYTDPADVQDLNANFQKIDDFAQTSGTVSSVTVNGTKHEPDSAGNVNLGTIHGGDGGGANINDSEPSASTTYSGQKIEEIANELKENIAAVNLLDNSDFEVAQAGYNGYHGNDQYCADRWFGNNLGALSVSGKVKTFTSVSGFAYMRQTLWNDGRDHGKTYTLVITLPDGTRLAASGASPTTASTSEHVFIDLGAPDNRCWVMAMKTEDDSMCVRIDASQVGASISFLSIDLFEGEYTSENAPPHVPKGYAVELTECRRYYSEDPIAEINHTGLSGTMLLNTPVYDPPMARTPDYIIDGYAAGMGDLADSSAISNAWGGDYRRLFLSYHSTGQASQCSFTLVSIADLL